MEVWKYRRDLFNLDEELKVLYYLVSNGYVSTDAPLPLHPIVFKVQRRKKTFGNDKAKKRRQDKAKEKSKTQTKLFQSQYGLHSVDVQREEYNDQIDRDPVQTHTQRVDTILQ